MHLVACIAVRYFIETHFCGKETIGARSGKLNLLRVLATPKQCPKKASSIHVSWQLKKD